MAGARSNVIEYVFEGNTLNLEQAVKQVSKLLSASAKALKTYQDGVLTAEQQAELKSTRALLKQMRAASKSKAALSKEDQTRVKRAGEQALKNSSKLAKQAAKVAAKQQESIAKYSSTAAVQKADLYAGKLETGAELAKGTLNAEAYEEITSAVRNYRQVLADTNSTEEQRAAAVQKIEQVYRSYNSTLSAVAKQTKQTEDAAEHMADLLSTSGQEAAKQNAAFLRTYAKELEQYLSPEAYDEIMLVVNEYIGATQRADVSEQSLATATEKLNDAFSRYSATLNRARTAMNASYKGVQSFSDLMKQFNRYIETATQSFYFWIRLMRNALNTIKQGIEYYSDYVESINFLEQASGAAADEMERFAKAQQLAFGFDPTEINTAAAMFYSFSDSMGFTADQATLISQNMTKLAQDIASLQNIDLTTAMTKLRSALSGQSRALAQLGVNVNDTNVQEWLLTKGINVSMNQMNEASQAAARYAFILDRTTAAQGDLARTIESPANQLKILRAQFKLLVQNIGSLFTGVLLPVLKILNSLLQPINAFMQALTSISASGFSSSIGDAGDQMSKLASETEAATDAAKGLAGIDEINQMTAPTGKSTPDMGISPDISALLTGYDNMAAQISPLVELFESLGAAMAPIWAMFQNTSGFSLVSGAFKLLGTILTPVKLLFDGIGKVLSYLPEPFQKVIGVIAEMATAVAIACTGLAIFKTLMATESMKTFIVVLGGMITSFKALGVTLYDNIKKMILWIANLIKTQIETLKTNIQTKGLWKSLLGVAAGLLKAVWAGVKWIASMIVQGAKAIYLTIKNWLLSGSLWGVAMGVIAAAGIGALAVAGIVAAATAIAGSAKNTAQNSAQNVPKMAKGGVATGPTFAMIGEGRFNEAVVPLGNSPQFKSMKQEIAESVVTQSQTTQRRSGAGTPVILQLNGKELARAILPDLGLTRPQTGVKLV